MPRPEDMAKALEKVTVKNPAEVTKEVEDIFTVASAQFAASLPKVMPPARFMQIIRNAALKNSKLMECSPGSLVMAALTAAQIGLEPDGINSALIPYRNKSTNRMEAQFQLMYQGIVQLFYRHSSAASIDAHEVKEKDVFEIDYGSQNPIKHKPYLMGDAGRVYGYYAIARLKTGAVIVKYMSMEEIIEHAKDHSKAYDPKTGTFSGAWETDFDSMARKTVIIQVSKMVPKSSELQIELAQDETSREFVRGMGNVLDIPSRTTWEPAPLDAEHEIQPQEAPQGSTGGPQEAKPAPVEPKVAPEEIPPSKTTGEAKSGVQGGENAHVLDLTPLFEPGITFWTEIFCEIKSLENKVNKSKDPKKKDSPYVKYIVADATNEMSVSMWGSAKDKQGVELKAEDRVKLIGVTKKAGEKADYYNVKEIEKL